MVGVGIEPTRRALTLLASKDYPGIEPGQEPYQRWTRTTFTFRTDRLI